MLADITRRTFSNHFVPLRLDPIKQKRDLQSYIMGIGFESARPWNGIDALFDNQALFRQLS
jgi:hypothetical protein